MDSERSEQSELQRSHVEVPTPLTREEIEHLPSEALLCLPSERPGRPALWEVVEPISHQNEGEVERTQQILVHAPVLDRDRLKRVLREYYIRLANPDAGTYKRFATTVEELTSKFLDGYRESVEDRDETTSLMHWDSMEYDYLVRSEGRRANQFDHLTAIQQVRDLINWWETIGKTTMQEIAGYVKDSPEHPDLEPELEQQHLAQVDTLMRKHIYQTAAMWRLTEDEMRSLGLVEEIPAEIVQTRKEVKRAGEPVLPSKLTGEVPQKDQLAKVSERVPAGEQEALGQRVTVSKERLDWEKRLQREFGLQPNEQIEKHLTDLLTKYRPDLMTGRLESGADEVLQLMTERAISIELQNMIEEATGELFGARILSGELTREAAQGQYDQLCHTYLDRLRDRLSVFKLIYVEQAAVIARADAEYVAAVKERLMAELRYAESDQGTPEDKRVALEHYRIGMAKLEKDYDNPQQRTEEAVKLVRTAEVDYWQRGDRTKGEMGRHIAALLEEGKQLQSFLLKVLGSQPISDSTFRVELEGLVTQFDNTEEGLRSLSDNTTLSKEQLAERFVDERKKYIELLWTITDRVLQRLGMTQEAVLQTLKPPYYEETPAQQSKAAAQRLVWRLGATALIVLFVSLSHAPHQQQIESKNLELAQQYYKLSAAEEYDPALREIVEKKAPQSEVGKYLFQRAVVDIVPEIYSGDRGKLTPEEARQAYYNLQIAKLFLGEQTFEELANEAMVISVPNKTSGEALLDAASQLAAEVAINAEARKVVSTAEPAEKISAVQHIHELATKETITTDDWAIVWREYQEQLADLNAQITPEDKLKLLRDLQPVSDELVEAYSKLAPKQREEIEAAVANLIREGSFSSLSEALTVDTAGRSPMQVKLENLIQQTMAEASARVEWAGLWADWEAKVAQLDTFTSPQEQWDWLENTLRPLADELTEKYDGVEPRLRYTVAMKLFDKNPQQPGFVWSDDELMRRSLEGESTIQRWVETMLKVARLRIDRAA